MWRWRWSPARRVKGLAICSDGKPAAGWEIYATPEWWTSNYLPSMVKIDAKGNFTLKDLGPGDTQTELAHAPGKWRRQYQGDPGHDQRSRGPAAASCRSAGAVASVADEGGGQGPGHRRPPGLHLGRLRSGPPPRRTSTRLRSISAGDRPRPGKDSVLDGSYTFDGLPAGTYQLQFQSPTTESKTLEQVKIPGEIPLVELKVVAKPRLLGTVTDGATSTPVAQFSIRVRKLQHLGSGPQYNQETALGPGREF